MVYSRERIVSNLKENFFVIIVQIGPLRCWPGGLCLSRSIGDIDVGEFIVPVPHVKQVKVHTHMNSLYKCSGGKYSL